jgi:hypothetical protein
LRRLYDLDDDLTGVIGDLVTAVCAELHKRPK